MRWRWCPAVAAVVGGASVSIQVDQQAVPLEWDASSSCEEKHRVSLHGLSQASSKPLMGQGCSHTECSALVLLATIAPECAAYASQWLSEFQLWRTGRIDGLGDVQFPKGTEAAEVCALVGCAPAELVASTAFDRIHADAGALLHFELAYAEARRAPPDEYLLDLNRHHWASMPGPWPTLFPESSVRRAAEMTTRSKKGIRFSFVGGLSNDESTRLMRRWVLDFAKLHFMTNDSYLAFTDAARERNYEPLGGFDHTQISAGWNPKLSNSAQFIENAMTSDGRTVWLNWLARGASGSAPPFAELVVSRFVKFDPDYFQLLADSQLVLAPAGDGPWSRRFFEAVLSCSIPIIQRREHAGRTDSELRLPFYFYIYDPSRPRSYYYYRPDWATANWHLFLRENTILRDSDGQTAATFADFRCPNATS